MEAEPRVKAESWVKAEAATPASPLRIGSRSSGERDCDSDRGEGAEFHGMCSCGAWRPDATVPAVRQNVSSMTVRPMLSSVTASSKATGQSANCLFFAPSPV